MFHSIHYTNILIMAELLLASNLFSLFLNKKRLFPLRLSISIFLCLIIAFCFPVPDQNSAPYIIGWGIVMYTAFFIIGGCTLFFCYKENFWTILFCITAGQTLQNMASSVNSTLTSAAALMHITWPEGVFSIVSLFLTYGFVWIIFSKRLKNTPDIHINNIQMLIISCIAVFFELYLALVVFSISIFNEQPTYLLMIYFYSSFVCIFILCIEFSLLKNKVLESELFALNQMLEEKEKQYQLSKDNIQLINLKCHDLKYQIRKLRNSGSEIDKNSLKEIENAIGIYDSVIHTGNNALDVILTEKAMICEKEKIRITCMIKSEHINIISPPDIYSLLGNAVDNAIEAVIKLSGPNQRNISINIRENKNMIIMHIENYYSGDLKFENGLPQTTKDDNRFHGFGMKSMKMIVQKYSGYLTTYTEGDIFHLNVLIPIPK